MRIFSGIQPTGSKHLGNYIGAIVQYVAGQERGDPAIYCIVDLHAITVDYDPVELRERVYDTTAILIAAGLDPERCILFRQSDVQEHRRAVVAAVWGATPLGELNRMHQFRDKSVAQRDLVAAGLLFYPVLMAADVLAYRAHEVPVGEDQREHVELMRRAAERFNRRFGEALVVPEVRIPEVGALSRPPGPDPQDVDDRQHGAGHRLRARRAGCDPQEVQARGHGLRHRDRARGGQARHLEPGRDPRLRARDDRRRRSSCEFADARYGDFKVAVGDAVVELPGARAASATRRCAPTRAYSRSYSAAGADRARAAGRRDARPTCASGAASDRLPSTLAPSPLTPMSATAVHRLEVDLEVFAGPSTSCCR